MSKRREFITGIRVPKMQGTLSPEFEFQNAGHLSPEFGFQKFRKFIRHLQGIYLPLELWFQKCGELLSHQKYDSKNAGNFFFT
jgi:hypothetical protein